MSIKIIFRVSVLIFALVMVIFASKYFSSEQFQSSLNDVFNTKVRTFQWCDGRPDHFKWIDADLENKFRMQPADRVSKKFCLVQIQPVQADDLKSVEWMKLAQGYDSGGQIVYLEQAMKGPVFRAAGLPFKSTILYQEFQIK